MPSAWIYQDDKQVKKRGPDKASWYVGWLDPAGKRKCKSCGPGGRGKDLANRLKRKMEAELLTGTYQDSSSRTWEEFRRQYDEKILAGKNVRTREEYENSLGHFERLVNPKRLQAITSLIIADFVAKRRMEKGAKPNSAISPATVNRDVRHLRAAIRKAHKWGYMPKGLPSFEFIKEPVKIPTYVTPEHFALIYGQCDQARWPEGYPFSPADWWRGLLIFGYMTGWRIGSILSLRRDDVSLDHGTALSRAEENKGKRDQLIVLHPVVVEHLRKLPSFEPVCFPWNHYSRQLWGEFHALQRHAGIKLTGPKRWYGFHDLRRAFATLNADRLTADALQMLMQHQDYQTTQRYINIARQLRPATHNLFVPNLVTAPVRAIEG